MPLFVFVVMVESQYVTPSGTGARAPVWPQDKHVTSAEAFHFAACVKRIGRRSKQDSGRATSPADDDEDCVELGRPLGGASSPIRSFWEILACCDGMCGAPLGMAVKLGFENTIVWLCCCLTFGGQLIVEQAEQRPSSPKTDSRIEVVPSDFDLRPEGYEKQESSKMVHPKPIPEVLETLKSLMAESGDAFAPGKLLLFSLRRAPQFSPLFDFSFSQFLPSTFFEVKHEVNFVIGMLDYMVNRLSSPAVIESSWKCKHGKPQETMVGNFLNLHCGHNNAFANTERHQLRNILQEMVGLPA